jgi:ornithine cyclodeaminase/alanine dehydrogenase-like protein (mu-crystallin family)
LEFEGRAYPVSIRPLAIPVRLAKSLAHSAEHLVTLLHTAANLYFEIILVNPFGMAIEDIAVAQGLYRQAVSQSRGHQILET